MALQQNAKDPIWVVELQVRLSNDPSHVLGADGRPALVDGTYGPPHEITAHAPDEAVAKAYVVQQNPGARIVSAKQAPK